MRAGKSDYWMRPTLGDAGNGALPIDDFFGVLPNFDTVTFLPKDCGRGSSLGSRFAIEYLRAKQDCGRMKSVAAICRHSCAQCFARHLSASRRCLRENSKPEVPVDKTLNSAIGSTTSGSVGTPVATGGVHQLMAFVSRTFGTGCARGIGRGSGRNAAVSYAQFGRARSLCVGRTRNVDPALGHHPRRDRRAWSPISGAVQAAVRLRPHRS